jgi:Cu+-exporting ATPase
MSREAVPIALAVATVLLLAAGGSVVTEHLRHPGAAPAARALPAVQAGQKRVTLEVSGMTCANCASRVTHALDATRGVVACDLDVQTRRATVVCDLHLADTSLVGAVARAGGEYRAQVVH